MILFLGTRPGKTQIKPLRDVGCPFCGQVNTLTLWATANYFHLFWIKLFKISTHSVAECSHCKKVYDSHTYTEAMQHAIASNEQGEINA